MRESFEHPDRFGVETAWNASVFFHGRAAELFTYETAVRWVNRRIVPVLWLE